jgi:pantothenate kinase
LEVVVVVVGVGAFLDSVLETSAYVRVGGVDTIGGAFVTTEVSV